MTDKVRVIIDPDKCRLSGECMKVCPENAINVQDGKARIDRERCDQDGLCIPACPHQAIELIEEEGGVT
jgi:NAD-dependent dihydropyrimidine dehydrogenase PreA subunit